ncbi:Gfo/Idh/MocA family protein [Halosimplex sp. TS25]|uniref:Gfo/Idh/MocA family protein n=1 Tax=Halosimplex rarum TaxID=3396619 RepID=UPI0039E7E3ED
MRHVLVVGCGSIGSRHVGNLVESFDVEVSVCDVDERQVAALSDEYGVTSTTDLDEALDAAPDAVLVCTPPTSHVDIARKAIDAGAHVFVEKPVAADSERAAELAERVREADRVGLVGCNMRFHPPVARITDWLTAGEIGRLEYARLRYGNYLPNWRPDDYTESYSTDPEQGGGIVLDAIHELDLASWWLGRPGTVTSATGTYSDLALDVEDTAEILIEREDETAMASVHLDYLRPVRARTYELIGTEGMIRWDAEGKNPEESTVWLYDTETNQRETETYASTFEEMYVAELDHFFSCIDGEAEPVVDIADGQRLVELAEQIRAAAADGRTRTVMRARE